VKRVIRKQIHTVNKFTPNPPDRHSRRNAREQIQKADTRCPWKIELSWSVKTTHTIPRPDADSADSAYWWGKRNDSSSCSTKYEIIHSEEDSFTQL